MDIFFSYKHQKNKCTAHFHVTYIAIAKKGIEIAIELLLTFKLCFLSFTFIHWTTMHFQQMNVLDIERNEFILVNQSYSHRKQKGFSNVINLEDKCMLKHRPGNPIDIWDSAIYSAYNLFLASWTRTFICCYAILSNLHIYNSKYS